MAPGYKLLVYFFICLVIFFENDICSITICHFIVLKEKYVFDLVI